MLEVQGACASWMAAELPLLLPQQVRAVLIFIREVNPFLVHSRSRTIHRKRPGWRCSLAMGWPWHERKTEQAGCANPGTGHRALLWFSRPSHDFDSETIALAAW